MVRKRLFIGINPSIYVRTLVFALLTPVIYTNAYTVADTDAHTVANTDAHTVADSDTYIVELIPMLILWLIPMLISTLILMTKILNYFGKNGVVWYMLLSTRFNISKQIAPSSPK